MTHYVRHELSVSPDFLNLHRFNPTRYPHLLESVDSGTPQARYDILFAFPGASLALDNKCKLFWQNELQADNNFLNAFDACWQAEQHRIAFKQDSSSANKDSLLPFTGGWFVYLGYELVEQIEPKLGSISSNNRLPLAVATRFPAALILDHTEQQACLICEQDKAEYIDLILQDIVQLEQSDNADEELIELDQLEEAAADDYLQAVTQIKKYICAGDVFQVNISRPWRVRLKNNISAATLYQKLKQTNPSPFAGLMTLSKAQAIISSSPERLLQVKNGTILTRPIAGTYPRSTDSKQDQSWSTQLLHNPKERAEHTMLIDLERNDLGRVCKTGTVAVRECMTIESYQHVHHIVSEISGELEVNATPGKVIRALFPGGTITGCPKVRTMEIIYELESGPREVYTGSMGFVNHNGDMDLNILIRTMVLEHNTVSIHAGAGIVADSDPLRELNETRAKAKGLLACFDC